MFESVKQGGQVRPIVYVTSLLVSLAAHAVIVCVLVIAPLVFFSTMQAEELIAFLYAPPLPPPAPPAPAPPPAPGTPRVTNPVIRDFAPPKELPQGIPEPGPDSDSIIPTVAIPNIPGVGGLSGANGPGVGVIPGLLAAAGPRPPLPKPPDKKPTPVRIGVLEPSKLIRKVNPVYPELAKRAHVWGDVILEAQIDEEGSVSTIKILSGHPLLTNAAIEAVRQWKYSPTILTGEPVPVIATVTVMFRLSN